MHAFPRIIFPRKATNALRRKFIFGTLFALSCSATSLAAVPRHSIQVAMSPESFVVSAPNGDAATGPQFVEHLGRKAVDVPSGLLNVKGAKMRDGTIDVDVATKSNALFAGIAFRIESDANLEMWRTRRLKHPSRRDLGCLRRTASAEAHSELALTKELNQAKTKTPCRIGRAF